MGNTAELLHRLVWGPWTPVLFLGVGLWFTFRLRGFQIFGARRWWGETAGTIGEPGADRGREPGTDRGREPGADHGRQPRAGEKGITPFQSACTALAATIGTGNIAGVATALTCGGAGALFWMWVSAAIGMATAYAETYLGQVYRRRRADGSWMCGPMLYMERGLGCPSLGFLYAGLAVFSSLGMGSMVQSNSVSGTLRYSVGMPEWLSGCLITLLAALVIMGGIGRISAVAGRLMPVSAGIYVVFSLIVIFSCAGELPGILRSIVEEALCPRAAAGGVGGFLFGRSLRYGLSRGVFSNEAGLGTLAVLHGAAEDTNPQQQGMWAMFEVFFDTIVICTLTALVILCVERRVPVPAQLDGAALTAHCFSRRLGAAGEWLVSGVMAVFAFATIVAWYYLGRQTFLYLLERLAAGRVRAAGARVYTVLYLATVFLGCVCRLDIVWMISDLWNGLMAFPNLLALLLLSGEVRRPAGRKEK